MILLKQYLHQWANTAVELWSGLGEVNGTYKIYNCVISEVPTYWKRGHWKGKDARYEIRCSWCGDWIISVSHSGKHHITLHDHWKDASSIDMLPENGWNVMGAGILVGSSYDFIEKIFDAPVWPSKKSTSYYLSKYAKNATAMLPLICCRKMAGT
jgi:hypothetical protein